MAVKVPVKEISNLRKSLDPYLFHAKNKPCVVQIDDTVKTHKYILVKECTPEVQSLIGDYDVVPYQVTIDTNNFSTEEILERILPQGLTIPTGFETVGQIAHFNLSYELMPYKYIIGEVTLEKNPHIKTVITKLNAIKNVFRTIDLEVIAGDPNMEVNIREGISKF